jgi:hypothetical protein
MTPFVVLCPKYFSISFSKTRQNKTQTHLFTIPHQKPHTSLIGPRKRTARSRPSETEVVAWDDEEEGGGEGFDYRWGGGLWGEVEC